MSATWDECASRGWTYRPGATLRTLVAERDGSRVFAETEEQLLARIADVEGRGKRKETTP